MGDRNTDDIREYARKFLRSIRAYLRTGDYAIVVRDKNITFDNMFPMTDTQRRKILMDLSAEDCVKVEPNNHPHYPEADVFVFRKLVSINDDGEPDDLRLYVKMYFRSDRNGGNVVVISFHEDEFPER